jgi:putative polyhydroxyalkanoate system protein
MATIHIQRAHGMDLQQARQTAQHWAEQAEQKYQLSGAYAQGADADTFSFERAGITGTMQITGQTFTLDAKLGFLMSAFAPQIEAEMVKKIDGLIASSGAGPATTV